ncbi:hypothetical protein CY35_04G145500 [Sphagnum magellanicum]|nr:hypothetical protein CY35_04G145500 [Sphagnum magellanicum]
MYILLTNLEIRRWWFGSYTLKDCSHFWSISLSTRDFALTNLSRNTYALLQTSLGPHDKYELCTHNSHFNATLTSTHITIHVVGLDNCRGHNTGWDTNFYNQ